LRAETLVQPRPGRLARIVHGGGGDRTRFICGYVACDRPPVPADDRRAAAHAARAAGSRPSASWMTRTLQHAAEESRAPRAGTDAVLTKLSELLFVEALRSYPGDGPGAGAELARRPARPHVSRVLGLMHAEPSRQWTVNDLGRERALPFRARRALRAP
jgi:hypothetical protein